MISEQVSDRKRRRSSDLVWLASACPAALPAPPPVWVLATAPRGAGPPGAVLVFDDLRTGLRSEETTLFRSCLCSFGLSGCLAGASAGLGFGNGTEGGRAARRSFGFR